MTDTARLGETFRYDDHTLVYDVFGDARAGRLTVVYLHGLLLDSELNWGIAAALAEQGHRVVTMDLLGHGRSDKPTHASEYRIDTYADQVFALMDHLRIERAVLGGLSLGANVSLFAATQRPERVAGLLLEMPVLERAVPSAALAFAPLILTAHYAAPIMEVTSRICRRLIPRTPFGPLNSVLGNIKESPKVIASVLHGVLVGPVAPTQDERAAITAPTLALAHVNDLIHPFDDAQALVELLPNATLVRARSPLELRLFPHRLTAEIVEFLARLDRAERAA